LDLMVRICVIFLNLEDLSSNDNHGSAYGHSHYMNSGNYHGWGDGHT